MPITMKDKRTLPIVDIDAELRAFEEAERKRLGLDGKTEQWIDDMANLTFTKKEKAQHHAPRQRPDDGARLLHRGRARGIGYNVQMHRTDRTPRRSRTARSSATAASATRPTSRSATW